MFDGLSALLVQRAGFEVAFLSGASLSFSRLGRPDLGLVDLSEVVTTVSYIRERVDLPLIVDADTGFGNVLNVQRTVKELEKAGASAIQIEDQVAPKRCGHMAGKQVIEMSEMVGKIRAALDARRSHDTVIIARTDALAVEGFEAALTRAEAYLEAGADALFIEGPPMVEQMRIIAERFAARAPLVHNMVEGGNTPAHTAAEVEQLGCRIALYPATLIFLFARLGSFYLERLRVEGSTQGFRDQMLDLHGMNALFGAPEMLELAARYA